MKKVLLLATVFAITLTACTEEDILNMIGDYTDAENLSGTTWTCNEESNTSVDFEFWEEGMEEASLVFTSAATVEGWVTSDGEESQKDWTGAFFLSDDSISISYIYESETETLKGIIEDETMTITIEDQSFIFAKEDE